MSSIDLLQIIAIMICLMSCLEDDTNIVCACVFFLLIYYCVCRDCDEKKSLKEIEGWGIDNLINFFGVRKNWLADQEQLLKNVKVKNYVKHKILIEYCTRSNGKSRKKGVKKLLWLSCIVV